MYLWPLILERRKGRAALPRGPPTLIYLTLLLPLPSPPPAELANLHKQMETEVSRLERDKELVAQNRALAEQEAQAARRNTQATQAEVERLQREKVGWNPGPGLGREAAGEKSLGRTSSRCPWGRGSRSAQRELLSTPP